jgi:hypothetical protein
VLAIVNRDQIRIAGILFALMILQFILAGVGENVAALGGLHPVNGIAILFLAHLIARGPRTTEPEPVAPAPATEEPAPG